MRAPRRSLAGSVHPRSLCMPRILNVAGAQAADPPDAQKADTRQAVVERMVALMDKAKGADFIVSPELDLDLLRPGARNDEEATGRG